MKSPLVGEYAGGGPGGCISRPVGAGGGKEGCGWAQARRRPPRRHARAPSGAARDAGGAGWKRGLRRAQRAAGLPPRLPHHSPLCGDRPSTTTPAS